MKYNQYAFKKTLGDSRRYWKAKRGRISSSNFLRAVAAKKVSAVNRVIWDIINPCSSHFDTTPQACQMGLDEEDNAKRAYERKMAREGLDVTVADSGICISNDDPWLATTPDGFVTDENGNTWLLEIKCLHDKAEVPRKIMDIARERGSRFYCKIADGGNLVLKPSHQYYYQILGQMALTGIEAVDFAIYAPRTGEMIVQTIRFNKNDWDLLYSRLVKFKEKHFRNKMMIEVRNMD